MIYLSSDPGHDENAKAYGYCQRVEYTHKETLKENVGKRNLLMKTVLVFVTFILIYLIVKAFC